MKQYFKTDQEQEVTVSYKERNFEIQHQAREIIIQFIRKYWQGLE